MKSARRASEIHKQRTGRPLRITKDVVLNEKMYEEIIPLPARCQLSITRPEFEHADFDKRSLAYPSGKPETRGGLDQVVAACWLDDEASSSFSSISHQPTPLQQHHEQQRDIRSPDMPLRMTSARGSNNYRHAPYPLATPNQNADRTSHIIAPALQTLELYQHHFNYSYDSPLQPTFCDERRKCLPAGPSRSSLSKFGGTSAKSSCHSSSSGSSLQSSMPPPDRRYHHHGQPRRSRPTSSLMGYPAASSEWPKLTERSLSTEHSLDCEDFPARDSFEITPSLPFLRCQNVQYGLPGCNYSYNPNAESNERVIK